MEPWRQCALWLISCRVLPPHHRVTWSSARVFDLAQTLRDGVLLCQLLNNLRPQTVNLKEINLRPQMSQLEHPHTVPADGAVGVEVEGHQAFWTCDYKPSILVLTTVPPHTDSLGVSTKTKAGLVTEDDPLPF
ncbi:hypothetical protein NFI96_003878 [Prochilodus magdalenae]|nr:hypothetical protein NFI96_003878 [Prochilodus magdalenae]